MSEPRLVLELVGVSAPAVELPRVGVLTLGSARGRADVVLEGQGVADVHCAIGRAKGGGWALKDLGSSYGTLVNGNRVQAVKLAAGDQIVVGSRRLRIVDPDSASAAAPAEPVGPSTPAPAPRLDKRSDNGMPGVSGYRVERRLGRGGMGQVFLAVQESLQRRVALKVLAERVEADADFVRRFQAEARAAAALNHPNVVTVHDVWEEGGRHWLSMEFMERGTLEARVASAGALPWREVLDVLSDAAKGLVYAELRGIVHRDIKPANLMQNEVGTTKIADLGLATHLEAEATEEGDRKIFGTPHFISPEQARGERVDARSDLYSLGATAYRLLTGQTPFEGATTRDILRGHFFDTPRRPTQLVPEVPHELEAVVLRLLAKKPEERFSSAGALLQELERLRSVLVHGVAASATPGPSRRWVAAALLVLFVAAAGLVAWRTFGAGATSTDPEPDAPDEVADQAVEPPLEPPPADGSPTAGSGAPPPAPLDDESALERLEAEAEQAWRNLPPELTESERVDELRRLAREHAGSTWSARFEVEARAIEQRLSSQRSASQELEQLASAALERLRAATGGPQGPLPLAEAFAALLAVQVEPGLLADDGFRPRWIAIWRDVVRGCDERARAVLTAADEQAAGGQFDLMVRSLVAAQASLSEDGAPPLPEDLVEALSAVLDEARATRAALAERLRGLDLERARYERARVLADRRALASAAQGRTGLERELRAFDVDAVLARLAALASTLSLAERRAEVAALAGDLEAARDAFATLARAWDDGGWKRRTLNDPRSRGRVHREAVGADARGVLLRQDDSSELVPWSEFCGRPIEVHQLFLERLTRAYAPEELEGIEALMRLSAVLQAVEEASEMLEPRAGQVFTEEEARSLLEGFELAAPWAAEAGTPGRLAAEREAAELLAATLRALTAERWGEVSALLERLLSEHRATLLVRLLSDGRDLPGLPPPPVPDPVPTPAEPPEEAPPAERDG